ncbi:hypothetical protein AALB16_10155 [Lachnospiraceae bacterium 62-35]
MKIQSTGIGQSLLLGREITRTEEQKEEKDGEQRICDLIPKLKEQPVRVTVSQEAYDNFRKSMEEKEQPPSVEEIKAEVERTNHMMESTIWSYNFWLSSDVAKLNEADRERSGTLSWQNRAENIMEAYTKIYDEIVQGYKDGTREKFIRSEDGYELHKLTMEEELARLDKAYESQIEWMELDIAREPETLAMLDRIEQSRQEWAEKLGYEIERRVSEEDLKMRYEDWKQMPKDIGKKMITIRDNWKNAYTNLSKGAEWKNVVSMINEMFETDEKEKLPEKFYSEKYKSWVKLV